MPNRCSSFGATRRRCASSDQPARTSRRYGSGSSRSWSGAGAAGASGRSTSAKAGGSRDGWPLPAAIAEATDRNIRELAVPHSYSEGPEIELAYHVVPSRWGRGYATEAGVALLEAAWRETDLDHVVAIAFPENRASIRVMVKLGMTYEGLARYTDHNFVRYSIPRPRDLDHEATN